MNRDILWRLDPSESLSDWTIQVTGEYDDNSLSPTTEVYHVHRAMLAAGSRRCLYFTKLFGQDFLESSSETSTISMHSLAADVFPLFLDYLYAAPLGNLVVTTPTAVPLYFLGSYFDNESVRKHVIDFLEEKEVWSEGDEKVLTYCEYLNLFPDEEFYNLLAAICARHLASIPLSSRLLRDDYQTLWIKVMQCGPSVWRAIKPQSGTKFRLKVASLLAEVCRNSTLDYTAFQSMTVEDNIPFLSINTAVSFLVIEARFQDVDAAPLSSLEERCVEILAREWRFLETRMGVAIADQSDGMIRVGEDIIELLYESCRSLVVAEIHRRAWQIAKQRRYLKAIVLGVR